MIAHGCLSSALMAVTPELSRGDSNQNGTTQRGSVPVPSRVFLVACSSQSQWYSQFDWRPSAQRAKRRKRKRQEDPGRPRSGANKPRSESGLQQITPHPTVYRFYPRSPSLLLAANHAPEKPALQVCHTSTTLSYQIRASLPQIIRSRNGRATRLPQ